MSDEAVTIVEYALARIHTDEHGCFVTSSFFDLGSNLKFAGGGGSSAFDGVTHDLWNIATLAARIDWTRRLAMEGTLPRETWRKFSSIDVEHMFVQVRSAMDHVAEALKVFLPKGGQLPVSFRKLRDSIEKYDQRLPPQVTELIKSSEWFDELRAVRDALVHQGGESIVFGEPSDGILFQVHINSFYRVVSRRALMLNEHVVHFDQYAGLMVANLMHFLDRLGVMLHATRPGLASIGSVRSYWLGFQILEHWMRTALRSLRASAA